MIIGVGIDIIEVARVQRAIERNPRFVDRVFAAGEIAYGEGKKSRYQHLAARFAAKEAFFKALGRRIGWTDVEVTNLPSGQPELVVRADGDFGFSRSHVSLSHLAEYALAVVILERDL
jgi:holo-[acyl-carrier protein] synthase